MSKSTSPVDLRVILKEKVGSLDQENAKSMFFTSCDDPFDEGRYTRSEGSIYQLVLVLLRYVGCMFKFIRSPD